MNKIATLKRSEDLLLELPEDWGTPGEKVSVTHDEEGTITISKMVSVDIDLSNNDFLAIAKMAHEKDITFNELCQEMISAYVGELEDEEDEESFPTEDMEKWYAVERAADWRTARKRVIR